MSPPRPGLTLVILTLLTLAPLASLRAGGSAVPDCVEGVGPDGRPRRCPTRGDRYSPEETRRLNQAELARIRARETSSRAGPAKVGPAKVRPTKVAAAQHPRVPTSVAATRPLGQDPDTPDGVVEVDAGAVQQEESGVLDRVGDWLVETFTGGDDEALGPGCRWDRTGLEPRKVCDPEVAGGAETHFGGPLEAGDPEPRKDRPGVTPAPPVPPPSKWAQGGKITVQGGDTLGEIARRIAAELPPPPPPIWGEHGLVMTLARANGRGSLADADRIFAGEVLAVPSCTQLKAVQGAAGQAACGEGAPVAD